VSFVVCISLGCPKDWSYPVPWALHQSLKIGLNLIKREDTRTSVLIFFFWRDNPLVGLSLPHSRGFYEG